MLTIEKVITLASVSMFAEVPDALLIDVASVLEEIAVSAGEEIVHQGDVGTSTYIIVAGKVRVHDGMKELRLLGAGEVFGEIAALTLNHAPPPSLPWKTRICSVWSKRRCWTS